MSPDNAPRPLSVEAFEQTLQELGLTQGEARAYRFLLEAQEASSATIARETGQSRGKIYETLRRLVEKGFATEEPTRPIRYRPTPLQGVVGRAATRLSHQLTALREAQAWLQRMGAPAAMAAQRIARPGDVHVLSGRRACMGEVRRIINESRLRFFLIAGGHFAQRLVAMPHLLDELHAAQSRGADVALFLPEDGAAAPALAALQDRLGADLVVQSPQATPTPLVTIVGDAAALEIIAQPDDDAPNKGDDVGVRIDNAAYADALTQRSRSTLLRPAL